MDPHPHYNHLTWMKNKYIVNSHFQTSMSAFSNSWEDQTFVDDVAFIWPPRSYTCSFCKRKFKSAQALGGHMNVHRRDRAKLKLSPTSQNEELSPNKNYHLNSNPNPNNEPSFLSLSSPPCVVLDQNIELGKNVRSREDSRFMGDHHEAVNLTIGLNLVVSNHNEGISLKRHKSNVLPVPSFLGLCSKDLDLELRLGDNSPKRK